MGKYESLLKALGVVGKAAESVGDDAVKALEKVPYKLKNTEEGLQLISPKAEGKLTPRDLDTIENLDPEMVSFLGENPAYLEHLKAEKGYGSKALQKLEEKAKKQGIDSIYLNASPLGTRGLSQEEALKKLKKFYESQGYNVAQDMGPNAMMYKKLMAGAAGIPITQMDEKMEKKGKTLKDLGIVNQDLENAALSGEAVTKLMELYDQSISAPVRKFITEKLSGKKLEEAPTGKEQAEMLGLSPKEYKIPGTDMGVSPAGAAGLGLEIAQDPMVLGSLAKGAFGKISKLLGPLTEEGRMAAKSAKINKGIADTEAKVAEWAKQQGLPYRTKATAPYAEKTDDLSKILSPEEELTEQAKMDKWKQDKLDYEEAIQKQKERDALLKQQQAEISENKELLEQAPVVNENTPNIEDLRKLKKLFGK